MEKRKTSIFGKIVIFINVIAMIIMMIILGSGLIEEECYNPILDSEGKEILKRSIFNSRFTPFEEEGQAASVIRSLLSTVQTSNASSEYIVTINSLVPNSIKKITAREKYNVELEYENDGYVSNIQIYDSKGNEIEVEGYEKEVTEIDSNEENIIVNNTIQEDNASKISINWELLVYYSPVFIFYLIIIIHGKNKKRKIIEKYQGEEKKYELDKLNTNVSIELFLVAILSFIISSFMCLTLFITDSVTAAKPIIYIYPEEQTEVTVELGKKDNLTCTYPIYEDKWNVIAEPDGTLKDKETGRTYYALYWEGVNSKKYNEKLEEGFIVKGEDTAKFLEEKLAILGLNEREEEEFIIYWLPQMQSNRYNYIRFQTMKEINENMPLNITPKPDTLIRIVMEWKGLNKPIEVKEQKLEQAERSGYTVVEWGGTEIK